MIPQHFIDPEEVEVFLISSFTIRQKIGVFGIFVVLIGLVGIVFSLREDSNNQRATPNQDFKPIEVLTKVPNNQKFSRYPDTQFFKSVSVLTNEQIHRRIMEETPGLKEALRQGENIKVIRFLRSWAAENVDLDSGGTYYWNKLNPGDQTLANMIYLFDHDLLGVYCGEASLLLLKIYHLFGYQETILYNSGVYFQDTNLLSLNEGITHVITLVKVSYQGESLWVGEDVLFDSEYRLPGDEVSNFSDILRRIKGNPNALVERLHDQRVLDREWLTLSVGEVNEVLDFEDFTKKIKVTRRQGLYKFGWDVWIKQESSSAQILRKLLDFEGFVYPYHLFLFPIGPGLEFLGVRDMDSLEKQYKTREFISATY